jgi:hypothetical protein
LSYYILGRTDLNKNYIQQSVSTPNKLDSFLKVV